jgi:WD40 repeat protein
VTASSDGTARIWDAASGKELQRLRHEGSVFAAAFGPDGTRIVTGSPDMTARIWDTVSGKELARLVHGGEVKAAAFSPDGARVVTASADNTARVWDAGNGRELVRLPHEGRVFAAAFSQDGARIVTASSDKTARVWDSTNGKELARLVHVSEVRAATLGQDLGAEHLRIVTVSRNIARLWEVARSTDRLVQLAKSQVSRCLSGTQRARYFLPAAPPFWCITGAGLEAEKDPSRWQPKWPYQSPEWRDWLLARQRGEHRPLPASQ